MNTKEGYTMLYKGDSKQNSIDVNKEMSEKAEMGSVTYSKAKQIKKSATEEQKEPDQPWKIIK